MTHREQLIKALKNELNDDTFFFDEYIICPHKDACWEEDEPDCDACIKKWLDEKVPPKPEKMTTATKELTRMKEIFDDCINNGLTLIATASVCETLEKRIAELKGE